jgi:hypothetical protein
MLDEKTEGVLVALVYISFLLRLQFDPEDASDTFHRNVWLSTEIHPRRPT